MVELSSTGNATGATAGNGHTAATAAISGASAAQQPDVQTQKLLEELQIPFDPALIRWRANEFKFARGRRFGLFFPHADPRAYKDRLNSLFGPMAWCDKYLITTIPTKILVVCQLTIHRFGLDGHSATGEEFARNPNATTTAEAQAFKRACASFGLGRYLYSFPGAWLEVDRENRPLLVPSLPQWATPQGWRQGLRPDSASSSPIPPVIEPAPDSAAARPAGCQNVVVQVLQMQEKLGAGLYRGLLKSVARVWCPTDIRDIELQRKALRHMEGALRGLDRLKSASEKLGEEEVARILVSFDLTSTVDIKDMDTLYRVVVAVDEAAARRL